MSSEPSSTESLILVAGANERFALPMAVTFYSALANLQGIQTVSIYIIDGGLREESRRKFERMLLESHLDVHVEWLSPELAQLDGLKPAERFSRATYLRLLIPDLLPHDCDRAIYLDCDLVVEGNLAQLWNLEVTGYPALAVQDFLSPLMGSRAAQDENFSLDGLSPHLPYCNAGLIVMNLRRWRSENIGRRALDYAFKYQPKWVDQDALNVIIGGTWGLLDPRWNVQLSALNTPAQKELLVDPGILHFTSPIKPWNFVDRSAGRSRFYHYLQRSGWLGKIDDLNSLIETTWTEQNEYEPWMKKLYLAKKDLEAVIPQGDAFILVDADEWGTEFVPRRSATPFLEKNGLYFGPPPDDETAIRELERLRKTGRNFIAFGWPAFWWLESYSAFERYLRASFRCLLDNERLLVFQLFE